MPATPSNPYDTRFCGEDYTKGEPSATNLFGLSGHANSDEWIWALQYNAMISGNQHNAGYYAAPRIAGELLLFQPTQMFIDAIQCTDGKSIAESPLFDYKGALEKPRSPSRPLLRATGFARAGNAVRNQPLGSEDHELQRQGGRVCWWPIRRPTAPSRSTAPTDRKGPCGYLWRKYLDIEEYRTNNGFGTKSVCTLSYPLMRLAEV